MLFLGYFPLISFILFIFFTISILLGELITNILYINRLEFFLIENLFSTTIFFFVIIFLVSIFINIYFFIKIWRIKHINKNDKNELLYLFFKLFIFSSCFYVDIFIDKSRYSKFFIYLNIIRNVLLGRILAIVANTTKYFFYMELSPIEKSINSNVRKIRKATYLVLLFISIVSFIFIIGFQSKDISALLPDFINFIVIIAFLLGCFIYYTKIRK